ncbi:Transforming growth factor beta-1-induced transcript 1 protein [Coemansia sp. RSA 1199]|nr:Transforming growth factor beta-1-induced transcript 1 protein [Coemansia sp. RSA 1199]
MPPESAVAMAESRNLHTTTEPDSSSLYAPDMVSDQTLKEALRTGDRDTVIAIVGKLTGQLDSLRMEAHSATQSADFGPRHADAVTGMLKRETEERRRLSSLPDITPPTAADRARDRKKRMTMAFGMGSPESTPAGLMCAYCGLGLDNGSAAAPKAALANDIGYCCSNCESILGVSVPNEWTPDGESTLDSTKVDDSDGYFDPVMASEADSSDMQCDTCHTPLGEEYVNVLGRRFHVTHFVCEDCNIPLYALGGYLQDPNGSQKFYCQRDYLQRFSPACHACSVPITSGEMVVALGRTYHSDCFVCSICQSPFVGDVCYEHDSQPLCEWHWYIQNGLLCTECGGIIKNQCVLTRGKKYHQTCAESKYGEQAVTVDEARRQIKASKSAAVVG